MRRKALARPLPAATPALPAAVRRGALAGLLLAAALACPAQAEPTRGQVYFRDALLADRATSADVAALLRSGGGFVDRSIAFRDLTGDDKADAVVRVHSGGSRGVVAVYVFSTDVEGGALQPVFRAQKLTRASTRVARGVLSYTYARYAAGDELCCPARVIEATLAWDAQRRMLRVAARSDVTPR